MTDAPAFATWQILDVGSIWMKEFAAALARQASIVAWEPVMRPAGALERWQREEVLTHPPLTVRRYPLQRGYSHPLVANLLPFERALLPRLRRATPDPARSPLVCSTPFYAPLAERWPGPVVYYSTDLTHAYEGLKPAQVKALDRRLCAVSALVCPNSRRIADYFSAEAGCDPARIVILPNATRASNVLPTPPAPGPGPLPADIQHLPRPIAGVLGDLSGNMDWLLTRQIMERTPALTWVFVGPTNRTIADPEQNAAREWAMAQAQPGANSAGQPRVIFTGAKPYGDLQAYARCFDVAVLPYRRKEPTFSGSSTRFYEHLAACRPMVATRGFAELMEKPPLLRLVDTPDEVVAALDDLRHQNFTDGQEIARWQASQVGTWEERARIMQAALVTAAPVTAAIRAGGNPQQL